MIRVEDRARLVRRRRGVGLDDRGDLADHRLRLGDGSAGEGDRLRDQRLQLLGRQAEALVGRELVEHVVVRLALAHGERGADRGLLDRLVGDLAADAVADRGHQHLGRGEDRGGSASSSRWITAGKAPNSSSTVRKVWNSPSTAKNASGSATRAYDGAGDVALVPLVTGELADHGEIAAGDDGEAVDPLAGAGVHLVRHRGRADLALLEALGDDLVAGHQPDRGREVGRARRSAGPARRARRSRASAGRPGRRW